MTRGCAYPFISTPYLYQPILNPLLKGKKKKISFTLTPLQLSPLISCLLIIPLEAHEKSWPWGFESMSHVKKLQLLTYLELTRSRYWHFTLSIATSRARPTHTYALFCCWHDNELMSIRSHTPNEWGFSSTTVSASVTGFE